MKPRIIVTDSIHEDGLNQLQKLADVRTDVDRDALPEHIGAYDALVVRSQTKVTREILEAGERLQVVGRAGVGVDNIDLEAATRRGVTVVNAPTGNIVAAAEHTVALLCALARHIPAAHQTLVAGEWKRNEFVGTSLSDKILGLVGLGSVAVEVLHRVQGFGMTVKGYDPFVAPEHARRLGVQLTDLDELLSQSDFLSVHTPLTEQTRGLIGAEQLARMKRSAFILNVARGGIIDESALLGALNEEGIQGAALDVFESEPPDYEVGRALVEHRRVIATPHLGASTAEAQADVGREIADEVLAVLQGKPARHVVNLPMIAAETLNATAPYREATRAAGKIASQLLSGQLESVTVACEGEIGKHDTSLLTAEALAGLLEPVTDERVNVVNAMLVAERRGLEVSERRSETSTQYGNLVTVELSTSGEGVVVSATSGQGQPHIVRMQKFWLDFVPSTPGLLIIQHQDKPGMIGTLGTIAGRHDMNIAFMEVGRIKPRGEAVMVVGLDEDIPRAVLQEVRAVPGLHSATVVRL